MTNFKYLKINKTRKIRYLKHYQKDKPYIVFLHGFMSDLEGKKPKTFLNFAKKINLVILLLNIQVMENHLENLQMVISQNGRKIQLLMIRKIVKKNKIILIGSSMGAWISLNQFSFFQKQIIGFLGIGSAPEFLENLMWKKFSKKMKYKIKKKWDNKFKTWRL